MYTEIYHSKLICTLLILMKGEGLLIGSQLYVPFSVWARKAAKE